MTMSRDLRTSARVMLISRIFGSREPLDAGAERRRHPNLGGNRQDFACDGRPVDDAEPASLGQAQHDVFQNRHARHERQLLVNEADAQFAGVMRSLRDDASAIDENFAAIGFDQARKDPDKRGLARAVGPNETMDLAGKDRQGDIFQRLRAAKGLADSIHGNEEGDIDRVPASSTNSFMRLVARLFHRGRMIR